mgnify:CR=1 FL=1
MEEKKGEEKPKAEQAAEEAPAEPEAQEAAPAEETSEAADAKAVQELSGNSIKQPPVSCSLNVGIRVQATIYS